MCHGCRASSTAPMSNQQQLVVLLGILVSFTQSGPFQHVWCKWWPPYLLLAYPPSNGPVFLLPWGHVYVSNLFMHAPPKSIKGVGHPYWGLLFLPILCWGTSHATTLFTRHSLSAGLDLYQLHLCQVILFAEFTSYQNIHYQLTYFSSLSPKGELYITQVFLY